MDLPDLRSAENYINRELSLLAFNERVLAQALDERVPLLERLKFLCISSNNLDEFFEIRVAGLKQRIELGSDQPGPDGLTITEQLQAIHERTNNLVNAQYACLNDVLLPALHHQGIELLARASWDAQTSQWLEQYFEREVEPVLSPLALDPARPFPRIQNKSLNFIVRLAGKDAFGRDTGLAIVQAPRSLPRVVELPEADGQQALRSADRDRPAVRIQAVLRAWTCSAATSSASPATATCSSTTKKSTTCGVHSKASSRIDAMAQRFASRFHAIVRRISIPS